MSDALENNEDNKTIDFDERQEPVYRNDKTGFITYIKPLTDKIYYKIKNTTAAIIYVGENWEMTAEVVDPFAFSTPLFTLSEDWAEKKIVSLSPRNYPRIIKAFGVSRYDTAVLLYKSRGIDYVRDDWFAWSEDDKIEDYHPRFNPELDESEVIECDY